jgi:hypothetical protein
VRDGRAERLSQTRHHQELKDQIQQYTSWWRQPEQVQQPAVLHLLLPCPYCRSDMAASELLPWKESLVHLQQLTADPSNEVAVKSATDNILFFCGMRDKTVHMSQPACRELVEVLKVCWDSYIVALTCLVVYQPAAATLV